MQAEALVVLAVTLVYVAAIVWPATTICRRVGFSPFLGVLAVIPIANLALLWYLALARWPAADKPEAVSARSIYEQ